MTTATPSSNDSQQDVTELLRSAASKRFGELRCYRQVQPAVYVLGSVCDGKSYVSFAHVTDGSAVLYETSWQQLGMRSDEELADAVIDALKSPNPLVIVATTQQVEVDREPKRIPFNKMRVVDNATRDFDGGYTVEYADGTILAGPYVDKPTAKIAKGNLAKGESVPSIDGRPQ